MGKQKNRPTTATVEPSQNKKKGEQKQPETQSREGTDTERLLSKHSVIHIRTNITPVQLPNALPVTFTQQQYRGPK
jgi:hypothetical protein